MSMWVLLGTVEILIATSSSVQMAKSCECDTVQDGKELDGVAYGVHPGEDVVKHGAINEREEEGGNDVALLHSFSAKDGFDRVIDHVEPQG